VPLPASSAACHESLRLYITCARDTSTLWPRQADAAVCAQCVQGNVHLSSAAPCK
jgi:hypothetical protein